MEANVDITLWIITIAIGVAGGMLLAVLDRWISNWRCRKCREVQQRIMRNVNCNNCCSDNKAPAKIEESKDVFDDINFDNFCKPQLLMLCKLNTKYECEERDNGEEISAKTWVMNSVNADKMVLGARFPIPIWHNEEIVGYVTSFTRTKHFLYAQMYLNEFATNFITMIRRNVKPLPLGFHLFWVDEEEDINEDHASKIYPHRLGYVVIDDKESKVKNIGCPVRTRYNN